MIIKLSLDSEVPLYQQLKESIILSLANGELKENEQMPSVRQLAESLSINLHTVNKAYTQLANEGYLTILKARGVIVNGSDKFVASKDDLDNIKHQITVICAQAKCRSVEADDICKMCKDAYESFEGEKND